MDIVDRLEGDCPSEDDCGEGAAEIRRLRLGVLRSINLDPCSNALIDTIYGHCLCLEQPCDLEGCAPCRLVEELGSLRLLRERVIGILTDSVLWEHAGWLINERLHVGLCDRPRGDGGD